MCTPLRVRMLWLLIAFALLPGRLLAQQTGILSGVVHDAQGAVLPGVTVTVTSGSLIGGERTLTTGATGTYQFTSLPPGAYAVTYELAGFSALKRDDIRVLVAQTTRLDVDLTVGNLQETVTVTGDSPVVDVSSTTTQTNISKEIYDTIPTGRNPWVMAALVPGVVSGRLDVGGTEGMQQYNLEAFGSADSQKSFSIDGLKTNWGGGAGGSTMQYYGFEMYEEYNMQTASGTAESDVSGVYMNMVTKSGGNRFSSEHNLYFMNDALQTENVDDALRARLGLAPGQRTGSAGNPIDVSYDWSSTLGGPIKKDKLWFFGATRRWRLDQFQIGALNLDGSQAIDDNRIENYMGKGTWQAAATTRASFMFNRNLKYRFHRRDAPYLFTADKASVLQDQPAQNYVAQVNQVWGKRTVFDARFGRMWGVFPTRYQNEVTPNDISIRDISRFTVENAATEQSLNPNHRYQANGTLSYFADNFGIGTHDLKVGSQLSWEKMQYDRIRNGDLFLESQDGVALRAQIANTPVESDHRLRTWSAFAQDRWLVGRATINFGFRIDGIKGYLPAQASPAGTFVAARSFAATDLYNFELNAAPRIGIAYDLFGKGRTAVKAYYGRFYNQFGSEIAETVNPNARINVQVPWNDGNRNLKLDPGELNLATFTGFSGVFPRMDADAARPYSDEMNVSVDHQVMRDFAVSAGYHRRQHRNGLGIVDLARPTNAYTAVTRTYADPQRGSQTITIYNLDPTLVNRRDRVITNVDVLESDYDGLLLSFNKRMSNRWQLLGGVTLQQHEGFAHDGTFTNPGATTDLNNPNFRLNRADSAIFTDIPWTFGLSGSYQLPYDMTVSGKYSSADGGPLMRTMTFSGLVQAGGSETVWVQPRGADRTETVNKFVDMRFLKRFTANTARIEATLDIFNLLNANHVTGQNEAVGQTIGRPSRILTPRIVRLGVTVRF